MEGRGRPSFYDISQGDRSPGMVRRTSRGSDMPYFDRRARPSSVPRAGAGLGAAFSPISNLSATGSPVYHPLVGTPIPSGVPVGPPGLAPPQPAAVQGAVQQSVETQLLIHTVQEQQKQISQMVSLVETLVSRDSVRESKGKGVGSLSDLSGSSMDVDEGGAPIRNPKAESYVPKLPALDGWKMARGRKAEIEAWVEYLEIFLPWLALFDDRIPGEIQSHFGQDATVQNSRLSKGESVRSTRVFLYLRQSFSSFPRGLDLLKQVEKEQGVPAGYEAMRRLHQELSVCSRIEASSLREEILKFTTPKGIANRPLEVFRCVQVELAKYQRLTAGFPDLALTEADSCMVMLRNLSVETKKYILLHAKIDSLNQLESALRFYDSNLRILDFQDRSGKGEHANPLQFERNKDRFDRRGKDNKGKDKGKDNKGKDKGKDKDGKSKGKGDEKGKNGKGNKGDQEKDKGKHQGAAATSSKDGAEKDQATKKKCFVCHEPGHFATCRQGIWKGRQDRASESSNGSHGT